MTIHKVYDQSRLYKYFCKVLMNTLLWSNGWEHVSHTLDKNLNYCWIQLVHLIVSIFYL